MLEAILASSLIATVISTFIGYLQNRKTENLQYITSERKRWREEIRTISEDIFVHQNKTGMKQSLIRLMMRINPYGKYGTNHFQDSHIWEIIRNIEETDDNFESKKNILLDYLSLLLKRDWEISKLEVKGDLYKKVSKSTYIASIIAYVWTVFVYWHVQFSVLTLIVLCLILISIITIPNLDSKKIDISDDKKFKNFKIRCKVRSSVYVIIIGALLYNISIGVDTVKIISGILLVSFFIGLTMLLDYAITYNDYIDKFNYILNINKAEIHHNIKR